MEAADLVVTGEGFLDDQSFEGKAVGGVLELAAEFDVPALVVAGQIVDGLPPFASDVTVVSLVDVYGEDRARTETAACVQDAVREHLSHLDR
jgi:glycerate kinase